MSSEQKQADRGTKEFRIIEPVGSRTPELKREHVVTQRGNNPNKNKHHITKHFTYNPRYTIKHFLLSAITDSFLSRVVHSYMSLAPKSKLYTRDISTSRLYPFDGEPDDVNIEDQDLSLLLDDLYDQHQDSSSSRTDTETPVLKGILQSVISRIILEDYDSKLGNFTAYAIRNNNREPIIYHVALFDLDYSLQSHPLLTRYKSMQKKWSEEEILSLIRGTKIQDGKASEDSALNGSEIGSSAAIAQALAETIGDLGFRTSRCYDGIFEDDSKKEFCTKIIRESIRHEIDELAKGQDLSPSQAVFYLFRTTILNMRKGQAKAKEHTQEDIFNKIIPTEPNTEEKHRVTKGDCIDTYDTHLEKINKRLNQTTVRFEKYLRNIVIHPTLQDESKSSDSILKRHNTEGEQQGRNKRVRFAEGDALEKVRIIDRWEKKALSSSSKESSSRKK